MHRRKIYSNARVKAAISCLSGRVIILLVNILMIYKIAVIDDLVRALSGKYV